MNKKKGIIITTIIVLLLLVIVGVTYAFFTYENGTKSEIVTGQIYMNYEETSTISLTGVFPETKAQALSRQDENGVFEFTITGRNTSKYPVYYEIDLLEGGVMTGKTEASTKILPEHVRIYLERDGEVLVDGETFKDWNNRRIYVDTVPANQTSNIEHKYTLRMWIDENVTISDTDPKADYTTAEWNDAYTSLKVRVVGDFDYKEVATDASCFAYNVIDDPNIITYDYPIITLDTSEEKVEACMANMMDGWGEDMSTVQDGYQSFCEGTGTLSFGNMSLKELVNWGIQEGETNESMMSMIPVISDITTETRYYELNTSEESVNACKEYLMELAGSDNSDAVDGYQSFCEGTGTILGGITIYNVYDDAYDNSELELFRYPLIERNVFTQVETPQVIEITEYDGTCGMDVVIPSTIEGLPVTRIAGHDSYADIYAFWGIGLTSVILPNTLEYIGDSAFASNNLTKIIIPGSVTTIGEGAFELNDLTEVIISDGVTTIGEQAFARNNLTQIIIPDSVTTIGLAAFASNGLTTVVLGKNVSTIGDAAFDLYDYGSGSIDNPIERIINKSGNTFNWKNILDSDNKITVQDPGIVATGTYIYKDYSNATNRREVLITSE